MELSVNVSRSSMLDYLQQKGWMEPYEEVLRLEKPGEGNMNVVVRVVGDSRKLILKQAKPYVVKYPQVPAPIERVEVERKFYSLIATQQKLRRFLPKLLGADTKNHLIVLEDLGAGSDYTFLYKSKEKLSQQEMTAAIEFIRELHSTDFTEEHKLAFPDNLALRKLNYEHLFVYPYLADNGFDLDTIQPGLQQLAMPYKTDERLKAALAKLGEIYLSSGPALLHGDYYPGSWLKVSSGFRVIDPEFCFFGRVEYDLGVMLAHLRMARLPDEEVDMVLEQYGNPEINEKLVRQFEGMEILRRIIGLAQLPIDLNLDEKDKLLKLAADQVKSNS